MWEGKECNIQYMSDNPDRGAPVAIENRAKGTTVRDVLEERQSRLRSADGVRGAPILVELHRRGHQVAQYCVIDKCSGFQSKVYHRGWAKCTSIFILRKHYCDLLSTGILRQRTMNSCSC